MRVTFGSTKFVRHWLPAHLPLRPHLLRRHHQRLHHASQLGSCPGGPRASWGLSVFPPSSASTPTTAAPALRPAPAFAPKGEGVNRGNFCTPSLPQSGGRKSRQLSYARIRRSTSSRFHRLFEQERGLLRRVPPVGISNYLSAGSVSDRLFVLNYLSAGSVSDRLFVSDLEAPGTTSPATETSVRGRAR